MAVFRSYHVYLLKKRVNRAPETLCAHPYILKITPTSLLQKNEIIHKKKLFSVASSVLIYLKIECKQTYFARTRAGKARKIPV